MRSAFSKTARSILGMNGRNLQFIRPNNPRSAVKLARNKLATKERLLEHGLPTAELHGIISDRRELLNFDWENLPGSVVVKPNYGLGGNGIMVLFGKTKTGKWIGSGQELHSQEDLALRVSNILDGNYSISNIPDVAYFEERLKLSEEFKRISYKGIPDIRVIVYNSVPVMAMLRLPTKASGGKANLAMGGLGVGINMATGMTTYATSKYLGSVTMHPDFNNPVSNIQIPQWERILRISIASQRAVGLGYAGIDVVLDKKLGPVILEVNGHPGLEIQNANYATLKDRLERVSGLRINSVSKGYNVYKGLFGEGEDESYEDLPIIGVYETIEAETASGSTHAIRAKIDTGLLSTTITQDMARRLGYGEAMDALSTMVFPTVVSSARAQTIEDEYRESIQGLHPDVVSLAAVRSRDKYVIRPKIKCSFMLSGERITTEVAIALDNQLSHPFIIGRRDTRGFLINPAKTK